MIRNFRLDDLEHLAAAFASWPKPRETFERYAQRVSSADLEMIVAVADAEFVGYLLIEPRSAYSPFADRGIPEIADFNVLPSHRRAGIGTALMDEAERRVSERSDTVGLGVGLYTDYGSAQRLYVQRGYVPDGAGAVRHGVPVEPAATVDLDDDLELKFTKRLRSALAAPGDR